MEDKRYDPYTGYEIKDEESTQEYHTQNDDSYRRYCYEDDHIEQSQQVQTSGIAIALLHLDIERAFLCNPTVVYTGIMFLWCIAGWMVKKLTSREMKSMKPRLWMLILGVCIFFGYAVIRNILVYQFGYDYLGDLIHYTKFN